MFLQKLLLNFFLLCLSVSCSNKHKIEPDIDKAVMKEIFPSLIDSMYVKIAFPRIPPEMAEVTDSITGKKELRPVEKRADDEELFRNEVSLYERDSIQIIVVLNDSIHAVTSDDIKDFLPGNSNPNNTSSDSYTGKSYLLQLNEFTVRKCFKLLTSSAYKQERKEMAPVRRELKEISFSRIILNNEKTRGMLTCEYDCGLQCGTGYQVYIVKENGKWKIDHIKKTWIA